MFGNPGSLTMYSTATRGGIMGLDDKPVGPADYTVTSGSIKKRTETVAPFDTSSTRKIDTASDIPSPAAYTPKKPQRDCRGSPIMLPDHFPAELRRGYKSEGPGPMYKPMDPFTKMTQDAKLMATKRPRVSFEKFVSNCVPTVYHPQDIRCFVPGLDGRMYPWRISRDHKSPGPKYDTYGIQTSRSMRNPPTDFSRNAKRPPLFKVEPGFSPADFSIPRVLNTTGGVMLSKTRDPKRSDLRYFDRLVRKAVKDPVPHPFAYSIPSCFDKMSPKAVSAPFKSKTKMGCFKPVEGPGPVSQFEKEKIHVDPRIYGMVFSPENIIKSFSSTEPRFMPFGNNEDGPSPCAYTLKGFAEEMLDDAKRHRPAFRNPKLGFLVSAEARDAKLFRKANGEPLIISVGSPRRYWRSMTPKKGATFPYHGPPPKYPNSPGPIYDTNPGSQAVKAKKTWNDPRRFLYDTAFLVSGCCRELALGHIDKDIPGPGKYYPKLSSASGGKLSNGRQRFPRSKSLGPGPCHKLHEKADSSIWRASHLGTFNSKLKQIGISYPNSGGFHAKVLDDAGDKAWRIDRTDDYDEALHNPAATQCMASVLKVVRSTC